MSRFFEETIQGLLEAVEIAKSLIDVSLRNMKN